MKQFLLNLTEVLVPINRKYFVPIFLLAFGSIFGQNGIIGTGFGTNDWSTTDTFIGSAGSSRIFTTTPNGTGNQYFRLVRNWGGNFTQFGPSGCVDTEWTNPGVIYGMASCSSGAFFINCPNTTDNYVFKTPNGDTSSDLLYFKVQGAVRSVSSVTQSPLASGVSLCSTITVTATLDGALATGQAVYLRYSIDGWATSKVVTLSGSGTTYTGIIPSTVNSDGVINSYYVFTSSDSGVALDGSNADLFAFNLNNNGGSNYSYTVSSAGTTSIPDPFFEQALITLGYDCSIDGLVLTSNISGVTKLDVTGLGITDFTGIEDFSSLQSLICSENAITTLNVNGLTNLYYLLCDNNLLTSLDVSALTNLQTLGMMANSITTLDVSASPNLGYLDCDDNAFTSINVNGLTQLTDFYCSNNQLSSLNVKGLTSLGFFECFANPLLSCILVDDIAAANVKVTAGDWAKDSGATYSICDCSAPIIWDGSVWSNITGPTSTDAAIIAGNYNEAANITACTLTINSNAVVTIPSGTNVTLNSPLTVEAGSSFTLSNNANLIQSSYVANSGAIIVNRSSNPLYRLDYAMWSSPVASQNLLAFSPATTSTRFYTYNPSTNLYNAVASPSTTDFATGTGYLIRMPNTSPDFPTTSTFSGVFNGVPNTGNVSLTGLTPNKYYAVGNPYPSTISAESFLSGNQTDGTLYFWRKTNAASGSAYATYTVGGSTTTTASSAVPNGTIQVGQGFIVKTSVASLNFTNAMRTANNANQIFKTKKVVDKDRLWLNLTNTTGVFSQTLVGYLAGATQGIDAGFDGKYINDSPVALTSNINNEEYTIQCRALPFDPSDVVPLNFKTDVAGDYTIGLDHVEGLFSAAQDIILKDNSTGAETDLKAGAYTFTAAAGVDNARFELKYQKTLGVKNIIFDENSVTVYKNKGVIRIKSGAIAIDNVKVFDIQGRLILEKAKVNTNETAIESAKFGHQVLIVKITSQDDKVVSKKVVN